MTTDNATATQSPSTGSTPQDRATYRRNHRGMTFAVVLIVLGVLLLAENFVPDIRFGDYWPILLIAIGASLLWRGRRSA